MTLLSAATRRVRSLPAAVLSALLVLILGAAVTAGSALASRPGAAPDVAAPPAVPTSARQIQNIDQVKTAIKGYYGDTVTTTLDPVSGTVALHEPSPTGNYATEVRSIEKYAKAYLDYRATKPFSAKIKPAILLDIDDTSLVTYNYEIYSNFVYNPTTNGAFVSSGAFPAVFGVPSLVSRARADGYRVFFLTGRPETQRDATLANLKKVGYSNVPSSKVYLKNLSAPWLTSCAPTCTTTQYKSLTRAYIESQGYKLFANFGDQYSDLTGGYAAKTFKMPNPMYYLP